MYIYIYIYICMGDVLSPPCFLTTLQYTKLHGIESLGIIFPTCPKELKKTRRNRKDSKTNGNNINTGYPALDPTANKYLSGSGWKISVVFLFFCSVVLLSFCSFCFYMCLFDCKCKSLKRLGENKKTRRRR